MLTYWPLPAGPSGQTFGQGPARAGSQPALSAIDKYAQCVCADQIAAFRPAVAAADPRGVFRNDWLTALFGL